MNIFDNIISGAKPEQSKVTPEALAQRAYSTGATDLKQQSWWKSAPEQTKQQAWSLLQQKQGPSIAPSSQNIKQKENQSKTFIPTAKAATIDMGDKLRQQGLSESEIKRVMGPSYTEKKSFKEYLPMAEPMFKTTGFEQDDPFALGKSLAGTIGNIPTSVWNIGAGAVNLAGNLIERPTETIKDIAGGVKQLAGQVSEQPLSETAKGAYKFITEEPASIMPISAGSAAGKVAEKVAAKAGEIPEYATSVATGLSRGSQTAIKEAPEAFAQARKGELTRESLFGEAKQAIDKRAEELSELGKGYEDIRNSSYKFYKKDVFKSVEDTLGGMPELKAMDLTFEDRGVLQKAMQYIDEYGSTLSVNDMFNLRKKLSSLSSFQSEATTEGKNIIRKIRGSIGESMKEKIPGLRELDLQYAAEREFVDKVRDTIYDKAGNVKENAISAIANLSGKGKEFRLDRLEQVIPGISDKIRVLKAFEEIKGIGEAKTGSVIRQLGGVTGGFSSGGPLGAIVGFILTNPNTAAMALEKYGLAKSFIKGLGKGEVTEEQARKIVDVIKKADVRDIEKGMLKQKELKDKLIDKRHGLDNAGTAKMPKMSYDELYGLKQPSAQDVDNAYRNIKSHYPDLFYAIESNKYKNSSEFFSTGDKLARNQLVSLTKGFLGDSASSVYDKLYDFIYNGNNANANKILSAIDTKLSSREYNIFASGKEGQKGVFSNIFDRKLRRQIGINIKDLPEGYDKVGRKYNIKDFIDDNEYSDLFKQYPKLSTTQIEFEDLDTAYGLTLNNKIVLKSGMNRSDVTGTIAHELQHIIQDLSGFGEGGSPDLFYTKTSFSKLGLEYQIKRMEKLLDIKKGEKSFIYEGKEYTHEGILESIDEIRGALDKLNKGDSISPDEIRRLIPEDDAYEYYRNISGEIEARDSAGEVGRFNPDIVTVVKGDKGESYRKIYSKENIELRDMESKLNNMGLYDYKIRNSIDTMTPDDLIDRIEYVSKPVTQYIKKDDKGRVLSVSLESKEGYVEKKPTKKQIDKYNEYVNNQEYIRENFDKIKSILSEVKQKSKGLSGLKLSTKTTDPLIEEAKKYNSFDEFKKSQGQERYHGTKHKFDKFDLSKINEDEQGLYGRGIYVSPDKTMAEKYGGNVINSYIDKDSNLIAWDDKIPTKYVNNLKKNIKQNFDIDDNMINHIFSIPSKSINLYKRIQDILEITPKKASEIFSKSGIDGITVYKDGKLKEISLFNDNKIKTEAQLRQIYNKAHNKQVKGGVTRTTDPLIEEAKKYKSAEEFIDKKQKIYHGSPVEIKGDIVSSKELGKGQHGSLFEASFYTPDKEVAIGYSKKPIKGNVEKLDNELLKNNIFKQEKLIEKYNALSDSLYKGFESDGWMVNDSMNRYIETRGKTIYDEINKIKDQLSKLKKEGYDIMTEKDKKILYGTPSVNERFIVGDIVDIDKRVGFSENRNDLINKYKGKVIKLKDGNNNIEYIVTDNSQIKTKQQLIDIYNKAHNKQ